MYQSIEYRYKKQVPATTEPPEGYTTAFQGKWDVHSNLYSCELKIYERSFRSSEHAYQYQKVMFYGRKKRHSQ